MRILVFIVIFLGLARLAQADSFVLANDLGNLLASEEICELHYNQDAIAKFIDEKVAADDLSFASSLQLMTDGNKIQLKKLSPSSKTAHCRQTKRVAKAYGFISK